LSIEIERNVLENACKEMIETILFCIPVAFKGTIYRVGKPPALITERITSGVIDSPRRQISWGLPEKSEYNPPGRPWIDYRDEPGRPLEAMAWCIEKQLSWTSADPGNDLRSVRLQVEGVEEDYHHMEPVLVRKSDLHLDSILPWGIQGITRREPSGRAAIMWWSQSSRFISVPTRSASAAVKPG